MPETIIGVTVNVISATSTTVSCNFQNSYNSAVCTIFYGPVPNCSMSNDSSTSINDHTGNALRLTIHLKERLLPNTDYCYVVTLVSQELVIAINGTFKSSEYRHFQLLI